MGPMSAIRQEALRHLQFVETNQSSVNTSREHLAEEVSAAPLFSAITRQLVESPEYRQNPTTQAATGVASSVWPQYGLLGLRLQAGTNIKDEGNLVYTNVSAPWSAFICGSQGSGKSHTLSCLLENALIAPSPGGKLSSPLAAMVLHYDKFTGFSSTQLCEAAYLYTSNIPVRILVSPSNYSAMKAAYDRLPGASGRKLEVLPMYLSEKHLNITTMKKLMGLNVGGEQPLYMEVVTKILREMAEQMQNGQGFSYRAFRAKLEQEKFLGTQNLPLNMRLQVLESFLEPQPAHGKRPQKRPYSPNTWKFERGTLTIIDLSCPFVGPDDACALFNICVSLFLEGRGHAGRIIALDEAHKFLETTSGEAVELTETLLSIVRQQRHLGTRVMIATQEPTVSPKLLDLCNVTIVHRFASPSWFKAIEGHIAGAGVGSSDIFRKIVRLATGEALVFCPTALLDVGSGDESGEDDGSDLLGPENESMETLNEPHAIQLGPGYIRLKVRKRFTMDGGRSILA